MTNAIKSAIQGFTRFGEKKRASDVRGIPGLTVSAGQVLEEYLVALRSYDKRIRIWREMRDHPIIGTLLDAIKLPILVAPITVQPAPAQSEGDKQAAAWLQSNLEQMHRQTWRTHMLEAMECIDFGFSIAEIVLEKRSDGRLWLKNLAPRAPETLYRWTFDEDGGVTAFQQRRTDNYVVVEIPLSQCIHVAFKGRKGNPEGEPLLRSLYRPWYLLKNMENLEAIGVERDVGGMPYAELSKETTVDSTDLTKLEDALKNLRNDEASYLITPPGVMVKPYGSGGKMYDVGSIIERYQKTILGRFFAQFLKLGMDNVGTQALVQGSQDFFSLGLEFVQVYLLETWNQQLVPYLFSYNQGSFPGMTGNPVIVAEKVGKLDVAGLLEALNTAVGAKLFSPSDVDEEWLRGLLDAPDMPDDLKGLDRDIESAPKPGGLFSHFDYDPSQKRGNDGKWIDIGGDGGKGKGVARSKSDIFGDDSVEFNIYGDLRKSPRYQQIGEKLATHIEETTGNNIDSKTAADMAYAVHQYQGREDTYKQIRSGKQPDVARSIEAYLDNAEKYEGKVYRGISFSDPAMVAQLSAGAELDMGGFSSWSADKKHATRFAGRTSDGVLIEMENKVGVSITHLSRNEEEREVLMPSTAKIRIKSVVKRGGIYHVKATGE